MSERDIGVGLLVDSALSAFSDEAIVVRAPATLSGRISRVLRRFDLLIETERALVPERALIEYKPGAVPGDVSWVDVVAARSQDVGISRVLLVAQSGFTPGAIRLASHYAIDLISLDQVSPDRLADWFQGVMLTQHTPCVELRDVILGLPFPQDDVPLDLRRTVHSAGARGLVFVRRRDGRRYSIVDLWQSVDAHRLFAGVLQDGSRRGKSVRVGFGERVDLVLNGNAIQVDYVVFDLEAWCRPDPEPLVASYSITDGQRELSDRAEVMLSLHVPTLSLEFHTDGRACVGQSCAGPASHQ